MSSPDRLLNLVDRDQLEGERDAFRDQSSNCFTTAGNSHLHMYVFSIADIQDETNPGNHADRLAPETLTHSHEPTQNFEVRECTNVRITNIGALEYHLNLSQRNVKVFLIRQQNSRSRLSVSSELFAALCEQCAIFDQLQQFVICFGIRKTEVFSMSPSLRLVPLSPGKLCEVPRLGRGFELAYVLRMVEYNPKSTTFEWSLRQSCVYHQLDTEKDSQTWILIAMTSTLDEAREVYFRSEHLSSKSASSLELHYILFRTALYGWRRCIDYLAGETQQQSDSVFMAELDTIDFSARIADRQTIKRMEDFIGELLSALSLMAENLALLGRYYEHSTSTQCIDKYEKVGRENASDRENGLLSAGFDSLSRDVEKYRSQLSYLRFKIQNTASLLSNMLELSNGAALKLIAEETKAENARAAILARKSFEDAATIKVLTVITLLYLPLTVVTNFFSTSFVGVTDSNISVTSDVWILFATGLPLTAITLYLWWIFAEKEVHGIYPAHLRGRLRPQMSERLFSRRSNSGLVGPT